MTRPWVVAPIAPEVDPARFDREVIDRAPTDEDRATVAVHGYCASFCAGTLYGATNGATVDEHGPFCQSSLLLWATGTRLDGSTHEITGDVVTPYHHGVYDKGDMPLPMAAMMEIQSAEDDPAGRPTWERSLFFGSGELRRMAAAFVRAADLIDGLDVSFRREGPR